MLRPRWRKVLADLRSNKVRTLLVVLSIAVGVFAVGTISYMYMIISRDMDASYAAIDPAGAVMYTSYFDDDFIASVGRLPGVGQVEGRAQMSGYRVQAGQAEWRDLTLTVAPDFAGSKLDRVKLVDGDWPKRREILIERTSAQSTGIRTGDPVVVALPGGKQRELRVSGLAEDRNADTTSQTVAGYVILDTVEWLDQPRAYNILLLTAAEEAASKDHVRAIAKQVEDQFSRNGGVVGASIVRDPGRHPAASSVQAIMALLAVMGLLALFLSASLVVNTVAALLAQHVRHIGVMKAVGARTGQIVGMYLMLMLCFGLLALMLAAPLAILVGYGVSAGLAIALNFSVQSFRLEPVPILLMVFLSLIVPLAAGLAPVLGGARTTIREAISGYGLSATYGRGLLDRAFEHIRGLPRPLLISLRNTIRRKARLTLTLSTLILGGAIFIGVFSVRASLFGTVTQIYSYFLADVNVDFDRSQRLDYIESLVSQTPGVKTVEGWGFASAEWLQEGSAAIDRIIVIAPPANSRLIEAKVLRGRWLLPEDQNAIVLSTNLMRAHPDIKLGDTMRLDLNGKQKADFVVVGVFPFVEGEGNKLAYANYDYLSELLNQRGQASSFRIVTDPGDAATQDRVTEALDAQFKALGYRATVSAGHTAEDSLGVILNTIILFLLFMAILIALVGGLGLMGTMTMNVLERTREIGVMRSVGASNRAVMQLVLIEGLLIGLLSWLGGLLIAVPIGKLLNDALGQALFGASFGFIFAWDGLLIWLGVVAILSTLASLLPAWNAARLTVREVLAYE